MYALEQSLDSANFPLLCHKSLRILEVLLGFGVTGLFGCSGQGVLGWLFVFFPLNLVIFSVCLRYERLFLSLYAQKIAML